MRKITVISTFKSRRMQSNWFGPSNIGTRMESYRSVENIPLQSTENEEAVGRDELTEPMSELNRGTARVANGMDLCKSEYEEM